MKTLLITLLMAGAGAGTSAWGMTTLPNGKYQGSGQWRSSEGEAGSYKLESTVEDNTVASTYHFAGGPQYYAFQAKNWKEGFFDVYVEGHKVGKGYCMSVQCHYATTALDFELEETLTFWQGKFYRIGSKKVDGKLISWEEAMSSSEQKAGE